MKALHHVLVASAIFTAIMLVFAQPVVAQGGRGQGGRNYNPKTEATMSGTIDEVVHMPAPGRGSGGLHLMLHTDTGVFDVHLGPAWYVDPKMSFAKGDALTVTGSRVVMAKQEVVIARTVKKGDEVLTLRDEQGFPLWAGRGRR
jgi:hypothetical protein